VRRPKVAGKDDVTGEPLTQRKDDTPDAVKPRLKIFHEETQPMTAYYAGKGTLRTVNADQGIDAVWKDVQKASQGA
jgi:adenylate kinase family enzyme